MDNKLLSVVGLLTIIGVSTDWSVIGALGLGCVVTVAVYWRFLISHPGWSVFGLVVVTGLSMVLLYGDWWGQRLAACVFPLLFILAARKLNPPRYETKLPLQEN